jgi:hypothetical protein
MDKTILFYARLLMPQVSEDKIKEYLSLIDDLPIQERSNQFYTELHHIIPRFLCKERSFLIRIPQNMKILSVSDHIQAHKKLMEIFPCVQTVGAYLMILRTCRKLHIAVSVNDQQKETESREWLRNNTPWKNGPSKEQRAKSSETHRTKHIGKGSRLYHKGDIEIRAYSETEWKLLEQEGWIHGRSPRIQKKVTQEVRKVCSTFKGTVVMRKGDTQKRVSVGEKDELKKQGWVAVNKRKISRKGTTYVTNGIKTISINQWELEEYLDKGWRQGLTRRNKVIVESCTLLSL